MIDNLAIGLGLSRKALFASGFPTEMRHARANLLASDSIDKDLCANQTHFNAALVLPELATVTAGSCFQMCCGRIQPLCRPVPTNLNDIRNL
jgi:hypothetical protein